VDSYVRQCPKNVSLSAESYYTLFVVNIALDKYAWQSSIYEEGNATLSAVAAVGDNRNTVAQTGNATGYLALWSIDLNNSFLLRG